MSCHVILQSHIWVCFSLSWNHRFLAHRRPHDGMERESWNRGYFLPWRLATRTTIPWILWDSSSSSSPFCRCLLVGHVWACWILKELPGFAHSPSIFFWQCSTSALTFGASGILGRIPRSTSSRPQSKQRFACESPSFIGSLPALEGNVSAIFLTVRHVTLSYHIENDRSHGCPGMRKLDPSQLEKR